MTPPDSLPLGSVTTFPAHPSRRTEQEDVELALVIVYSADVSSIGRRIALAESDLVVVGRDPSAVSACVTDLQLSRVHFRVGFDRGAGRYRIGDAASRNGTFVDGRRTSSSLLEPGSVIRAGETVLVLSSADPMDGARALLDRVASSKLPVLILGETGTGKERLARRVHERSGRSGPFVALNCATLSPDLTAAELFGHTRGAFSGAATSRQGLFRRADEGTLFLDEIGDLSPALQPMLLRALQESSVRPVGGDEEIAVNARIVAATHVTLDAAVEEQRFRGDLYSRLARAIVRLPPLRERRASLLSIAREIARDAEVPGFQLTSDAAEALTRFEWPYNVRQLESLVQGFATTEPGGVLDLPYLTAHLPELCRGFRPSSGAIEEHEDRPPQGDRRSLEALLVQHRGNVSHVAEALGKPRSQVYRWFKVLGLVPSRYRRSSL